MKLERNKRRRSRGPRDEARNALATLGITNVWFSVQGHGLATCMQSLANWDHGESLEQLVRLVRLTRPEAILTFFRDFYWRRHATTKLPACWQPSVRCCGDPVAFAEQVAGRRSDWTLSGEFAALGPKKIYYFPDADRETFFAEGPEYSVKEIYNRASQPYWRMALDSFRAHRRKPSLS